MSCHQRDEEVAQETLGREFRPGYPTSVGAGLGTVALGADSSSVDAEGEARDEVGCERGEDEDRLERWGLVVGSRQEEEVV